MHFNDSSSLRNSSDYAGVYVGAFFYSVLAVGSILGGGYTAYKGYTLLNTNNDPLETCISDEESNSVLRRSVACFASGIFCAGVGVYCLGTVAQCFSNRKSIDKKLET